MKSLFCLSVSPRTDHSGRAVSGMDFLRPLGPVGSRPTQDMDVSVFVLSYV
jgi:hypothetical protein